MYCRSKHGSGFTRHTSKASAVTVFTFSCVKDIKRLPTVQAGHNVGAVLPSHQIQAALDCHLPGWHMHALTFTLPSLSAPEPYMLLTRGLASTDLNGACLLGLPICCGPFLQGCGLWAAHILVLAALGLAHALGSSSGAAVGQCTGQRVAVVPRQPVQPAFEGSLQGAQAVQS